MPRFDKASRVLPGREFSGTLYPLYFSLNAAETQTGIRATWSFCRCDEFLRSRRISLPWPYPLRMNLSAVFPHATPEEYP